jgi:molybdopterin synthase sulfur carrier subunit
VKVKILYFASLRESVGRDSEELELPPDVKTVADLRRVLRARGETWEKALDERRLVRFALNRDMASGGASLKAGDEVAFFPPVTGG